MPVDLLAVQRDNGDVGRLEQVVLRRGRGAGQLPRLRRSCPGFAGIRRLMLPAVE